MVPIQIKSHASLAKSVLDGVKTAASGGDLASLHEWLGWELHELQAETFGSSFWIDELTDVLGLMWMSPNRGETLLAVIDTGVFTSWDIIDDDKFKDGYSRWAVKQLVRGRSTISSHALKGVLIVAWTLSQPRETTSEKH